MSLIFGIWFRKLTNDPKTLFSKMLNAHRDMKANFQELLNFIEKQEIV